MPSTPTDLDPYNYLIAHIPSWFATLDSITRGTAHRQLDALVPANAPDPTAPANHASITTLPPNSRSDARVNGSLEVLDERPPSPRAQHPDRDRNTQVSSNAKRKRDNNASASAHAAETNGSPGTGTGAGTDRGVEEARSRTAAYRERNAKLVLFDKEAQSQFEALVAGITDAKNKIRKTKAAARLSDMAHRAAAVDEVEAVDGEEEADGAADDSGNTSESIDGDKVEKILAAARTRRTNSAFSGMSAGGRTAQNLARQKAEVLERTDKGLMQAQDLCETAAFQLLRDGDCRVETRSIREKLQDVLDMAEAEAVRLREDMASERAKDLSLEKGDSGDTIVAQERGTNSDDVSSGIAHPRLSIEDDEDEEDDMPLPPVRLTSRMRS